MPFLFLTFLLIAASTPSCADNALQTLPKWEIGIGPGMITYPDYPGSKEYNTLILPFPYIVYRGETFSISQREAKKPLLKKQNMELDLSLAGSIPVSSRDNQARKGMDDLDGSVELGPVTRYTLWENRLNELKFEWPVRAVIASDFRSIHQEGWVTSPGLYYFYRKSLGGKNRLKLTLGLSAGFATSEYHNYFYGVASHEATSKRAAYRAEAGFSGLSYSLGLNWHFDKYWLGAFYKGHDLSQAEYRDSPLLETTRSEIFGLALTWNFHTSDETVQRLE